MRNYHLRIEKPDGSYVDTTAAGDDLLSARARCESAYSFTSWDWRGFIAFVDGAKPIEETLKPLPALPVLRPRRRLALS